MPSSNTELLQLLQAQKQRQRFNKINYYDPYPYQLDFHKTGNGNSQRLLMAANRIGKSYCGAAEMSYHLTGLYPDWWEGRRYDQPITAWAGGVSNETTRDIVQAELLGSPDDLEAFGSGSIPQKCIIKTERKPGVPNAKSVALIRHITGGNSALYFKAYEMGVDKWQGRSVDVVWLDEEPSRELYSQAVTRTLDRRGMVYMTFTPEQGMTETVASFMNRIQLGQSLSNATWDDASESITSMKGEKGHLSEPVMQQILSAYSPHEREMRRYGRPSIGSGLIFPVSEDELMIDPISIEEHWPRIAAIDFGWDHPTAVVWCAVDNETDTFYVYDCYRASKASPAVHAEIIKQRPRFIPIAYPHDGNRRDSMGNPGLADQYRSHGCNFLLEHFTNPPALGQTKGSNSIEEGLMAMIQYMEDGRFKVFNTLGDWFEEFRMYHRKQGKVVAIRDDLMSATRYAFQSQRHAIAGSDPTWTNEITYRNYGIV
jgi:phage terminase large subunit-like protein|tara:strand:- start:1946 stop:3397 length:1452 start_codon:yes stop_codon:yes gene_type:complete